MHWFWRALIAIGAGCLLRFFLFAFNPVFVAMMTILLALVRWEKETFPWPLARWMVLFTLEFLPYLPVFAVVLGIYGGLTRAGRRELQDPETRCRKCGYILHGLSEPRCPECGERI